MERVAEILITILIPVGGAFALIGSWGLVRLPSLMTRLHGPTKATTLGVGSILIASMLYFPVYEGRFSAHELLITLFLFITAPITANMIAKAHLHRQGSGIDPNPADEMPEGLPDPTNWATFRTNASRRSDAQHPDEN
ncbi:Na+/H+ antiporter subunit G [Altericroceibacterium xinjiangense]|uniref:Na+/H+ antiporter subunit G n=1 Tax=Altericroceibacterium xinjiangense TaxID=762261 RepID=UPI000F7F6786|nr:Na+/H+ antiporter subunit G [Altericroceibacterium xinjiangense]